MTKDKHPVLSEHFERLKELMPDVYAKHFREERETKNQKLFRMLKHSLGVIEAVYLQNSDNFSLSKAEEYSKIIEELEQLGYNYSGQPELMSLAARYMIMKSKKPMEKALGSLAREDGEDRKAM
ncbi:MAG: hypothetical protein RLN88_11785 [Ekhidna sp.]|uniref:hypothetical protein n=1 Tax=Ekhidna sp. TaxID=2608089 RepID=UPI0032EBCB79